MLLYGISVSIIGLLYDCNRGYLLNTTEIPEGNRGKMGVDSSSSSNDSRSIINRSCVEVCLALCFFRALRARLLNGSEKAKCQFWLLSQC